MILKNYNFVWNLLYKHLDAYGTLQVITELTHLTPQLLYKTDYFPHFAEWG